MLFRPSTKTKFRNAAIGAGLVTLAAVSAFPVNAQQATNTSWTRPDTSAVTLETDCKAFQPGVLGASHYCEIQKGKLLDAQGKALDAQANMLATQNACIAELVKFKKAFPDKAEALAKEIGKLTRENACEAAGRIPKPTANASPRIGG